MNYLKYVLLILMFPLFLFSCGIQKQITVKENTYLADPTIFKDKDMYYLYGTNSGGLDSVKNGFLVYESKDLEKWTNKGYALKRGDAFGDKGFWAPQVFKHNNTYFMAYTANESIAMATSNSTLGPFTDAQKQRFEASVKLIDPFIFFDNGKAYLYHVRLENGNRIFVAELNDDLRSIKEETLIECISAQDFWEDTKKVKWKVAEGPTVIKRKDLYYLLYSANDFRNQDYAVGYATSKSPMGPWKKANNNPIIDKNLISQFGTGHGDILIDGKKVYYVFHTHFSKEKVRPRKTAIIELVIDENSGIVRAKQNTDKQLIIIY